MEDAFKNLKVLVVDDSEFFRNQSRGLLDTLGITELQDCEDPKDALKLINRNTFDLALIDLVMPKMNGIELVKEIRRINSSLYIVTMSTLEIEKIEVDSIDAGANDFLRKPINPEELKSSLEEMIKGMKNE